MTRKHVLSSAVAVVALTLSGTSPSHATLFLSLADNMGHSTLVIDQGVGDTNPVLGAATFIGILGNFMINVTTGLSKPAVGSAASPVLDLASVDVTSVLGGKLTLEVTDTDFIGSGGIGNFLSAIGGTQASGSALTYSTFADCSNSAFGPGTSLSSQSFSAGGSFNGSQSSTTALCGGKYSLTEEVALSVPGGFNTTSFDAALTMPEPNTAALFGVGLLALAFVARRKRVA